MRIVKIVKNSIMTTIKNRLTDAGGEIKQTLHLFGLRRRLPKLKGFLYTVDFFYHIYSYHRKQKDQKDSRTKNLFC